MKHGSHIMLQRLVRSMVRTAPRPCWMDDVPWSCRPGATARKSRPGKEILDAVKKRGVDGQSVGEGAVHGAGLLDHNRAIALDDVRADFPVMPGDQLLDGLCP